MAKIFTHPARQKQFEQSVEALRKAFPNAKESFIRAHAWSTARKVAVPKKAKPPRVQANVAQTYRAPTRAERNSTHRNKMEFNKGNRPPKGSGRRVRVLANLSRNHPDRGCTPAEHAANKAGRLA